MRPEQIDVIADQLLEFGVAPGMVERVRMALDPCTLLVSRDAAEAAFAPARMRFSAVTTEEAALLRSLRSQALTPLGVEPGTEDWREARTFSINIGLVW